MTLRIEVLANTLHNHACTLMDNPRRTRLDEMKAMTCEEASIELIKLDKQKEKLKAALLAAYLENVDPSLPSLDDAIKVAASQLAREMPDIFEEEME